jgi:hypothetical protein
MSFWKLLVTMSGVLTYRSAKRMAAEKGSNVKVEMEVKKTGIMGLPMQRGYSKIGSINWIEISQIMLL